jgi:hypothetical protein
VYPTNPSVPVSVTPILDSGQLPPPTRKLGPSAIVGGILSAGVTLFLMLKTVDNPLLSEGYGVALLFPAFFLAVATHELGHLVGGWIVGFHFSFIQVGPFSLRIEHGRLKVAVSREISNLGYAGMHVGKIARLHRRFPTFIASGPLSNLLSAGMTIVASQYFIPSVNKSWISVPVTQFLVISLLLGLIGFTPAGYNSDGSRLSMLCFNSGRARRWITITALANSMNNGSRGKDWKQTWLNRATSIRDSSVDEFYANWMAYISTNDRKDVLRSEQYLERCLELTPFLSTTFRALVAQEAAVFSGWFRTDSALSEKWNSQVRKSNPLHPLMAIRVDVALSCARQDYEAALSEWEKGLMIIEKVPVRPSTRFLRESWMEWKAEIEEKQQLQLAAV